jgi:hypothetical protein
MSKTDEGKDAPFPMKLSPDIMKFTILYQGPNGPKNATHAVVHSANQLLDILPNAGQDQIDPGKINFAQEEVVIVGLGERKDSSAKVEIQSIVYLTDRGNNLPSLTLINYREILVGGVILDVLTHPVHVVKLQKLDGAVQFTAAK